MASVQSEYLRFLEHLAQRGVHDDVRRLAHLVLSNLDPLAEVGAARRGRSTRLAPLAIAQLEQAPIAFEGNHEDPQAGQNLGRLHQLEVGPFRGFMRSETFDLSHDITLVYGANGTGKSSFFEALEVAMLGSISEALAKRLEQRLYCNNARLRRHTPPLLSSRRQGETVLVQPDEAEYRFCFIEKNRLDNFARIAARTPNDQRQLIATLFGVDQFSDFVRGFNPSLDQDLMLTGTRAIQLMQRRQQLSNSEQTIAAYAQKSAGLDEQERLLALRISPQGAAFSVCVDWLLGTPTEAGRLPQVRAQLDAAAPALYEVTPARLQELLEAAYRTQGFWQEASGKLAARAGDVSYSKLYEAVLALAEGANICPACGTELAVVAQDPFERAREGLAQLHELSELQQQERQASAELTEAVRALWEEMCHVVTTAAIASPVELQTAQLPGLPPTPSGSWLAAWVEGEQHHWKQLLQISGRIEQLDVQARQVIAQRDALLQERTRLEQYQLDVERLRALRETANQDLAAARQTVAEFDETNRELIQAVEQEVPLVAHNHRIKAAYDGFLPEIQDYMAALPGVLLQGLGEQARDLYNAFNRGDPQGDLLLALWLPVAENGKIEVEFAGEPQKRYDALIVLSEGHIRCLGLAILLAKNISQGCPVVIFDDVVNAIDDEHRDGIWRTFFEQGLLDGKQVILTSHAEEFLHRIQQELGAERAAGIRRYKFLPHNGEHHLRVDSDPPIKNYVLLAQAALAHDEKREALRQARPALESLTDRVWTWLGRRGDGRIELRLGGPRSPWELNNKCNKLRAAVGRIAGHHRGADEVVNALNDLVGVASGSIEWGYLNSGVHDSQRDHEFDRATVQTIVESVAALDRALEFLTNR